MRALVALLVAALVALGGLVLVERHRRDVAEQEAGLSAARVVGAVFAAAQDLRVATLTGTAVSRSTSPGWVFAPEQTTRAPFSVSYFVKLRDARYRAVERDGRKAIVVRIPDVTVDPPSIDFAAAQVSQRGAFISRAAGRAMQQAAARQLAGTVRQTATSPANIAKARAAAVAAVTQTVRRPLDAAGFGAVAVEVRFPWQGDGAPSAPMDRSRSLAEVFGLDR